MTTAPEAQTLTPEQTSAVCNALRAAGSRWREWSEEIARADVAQRFAEQADEADALADMIGSVGAVTLGSPQVVAVPDGTLCAIAAERATDLTREETAILMGWCDLQTESLWDGMSLQSILNVYRASAEWVTWEGWREEEFDAAGLAWDAAVVEPGNRLLQPTR
jgi:hypothetical protein